MANTKTQHSDITNKEDMDFILGIFGDSFEPKDYLSIDEWIDKVGFMLPSNTSEPGRYTTERAIYQKEILRRMSPDDPAKEIVLVFGSQMGKTTVENIAMCYYIAESPSPIGFAFSDEANLKNYVKNKFDPMLNANDWIKEKLKSDGKSAADSLTSKIFPGGFLKFLSGKSEASMRSDSMRIVIADELDAMGITKGGDPKALLRKRQNTFKETSKMILSSTPIAGGVICDYLLDSTNYHYLVPCPRCGEMMEFTLDNLRWYKTGEVLTEAWMECPHCHGKIRNEEKLGMMPKGEWVSMNPSADPTVVGYYLPSFYAPVGWIDWLDIAKEYVDASEGDAGIDHDKMTTFYNTILGMQYQIGADNTNKWRAMASKAKESEYSRGEIPEWVNLLTTGADVQGDRIEVSLYGWGEMGKAIAIEHWIINFDDAIDLEIPTSPAWSEYTERTVGTIYTRADGYEMRPIANAIDSSYKPEFINNFWNSLPKEAKDRVFPIRGRDNLTGHHPTRRFGKQNNITFWDVPVSSLKHEVFEHLNHTERDSYTVSFPKDYGDEYYQQLFAESWEKEGTKWKWVKTRARNEVLDCAVYNLAMFYLQRLDSWTRDEWQGLAEEQRRQVVGIKPKLKNRGRRVLSQGI